MSTRKSCTVPTAPCALLRSAHETIAADVTDDAAMVEAMGEPVAVVEGEPANIKLTTPADLERARMLLAERGAS